jgi:hypothetical protein
MVSPRPTPCGLPMCTGVRMGSGESCTDMPTSRRPRTNRSRFRRRRLLTPRAASERWASGGCHGNRSREPGYARQNGDLAPAQMGSVALAVVGGGQAGLATSRELTKAGLENVGRSLRRTRRRGEAGWLLLLYKPILVSRRRPTGASGCWWPRTSVHDRPSDGTEIAPSRADSAPG